MKRRRFLTLVGLAGLVSASRILVSAAVAKIKPLLAAIPESKSSKPVVFYVATNGDDSWSGQRVRPNRSKTDGPFATIKGARDAVRELKQQQEGILKQPITVFVRRGTYFFNEFVVFSPEDSGNANCPIIYQAYQDEKPIFSAGRIIRDWQPVRVNGKLLWTADIPEVREEKWLFWELWVNGERRNRTRYPKNGYLKVLEVPDVTPQTPWSEGQNRFRFARGELEEWQNIQSAEVVVMTRWVESRLPITAIDETQRLISFSQPSAMQIYPGDLYYIENALEILDRPGEWYLDSVAGKIYYFPKANEELNVAEIVAPTLPHLIYALGIPEQGKFVEYLWFRGLTFSHTEWYGRASAQAAYFVPGSIILVGVRHCSFVECSFAHIGNYGIELARGCQENEIVNCQLFDLGAGGIKIGEDYIRNNDFEKNHSNKVANCHVYDGGRIFHSAVGVWIGQSYNNRIYQNHIHDFFYTGVSLGWTWGYGPTLAKNNIVEFNHIHHIGLPSNGDDPLLNDKGGIYTLGVQPGTVIRYNNIHDIGAFNYGGWGIYLDEGSSQIVVEKNIVYRTRDGGFHLHYGKENLIQNNIFALGTIAQVRLSSSEPHLSFRFENNLVYWSEGTLLFGQWKGSNFACDRNLYWRVGNQDIQFSDLSWQEWQAKGKDQNSIIADPLFIAPERGDFRLNPNSPAFQLGFEPISLQN